MDDIVKQMLKAGIDLPLLKDQLNQFIQIIQEEVDADGEFEDNEIENLLASLQTLKEMTQNVNSIDDISTEEFENIYPHLVNYLTWRFEMESNSEACDEDHEHGDCCGHEDCDEDIGYVELDDIDIEEFKKELVEAKNFIADEFPIVDDSTPEEIETMEAIFQLIEKLQNTFANISSLDELDQETLEATRVDYDRYYQIASAMMDVLDDEYDDIEDFNDLDLEYADCEELSTQHND